MSDPPLRILVVEDHRPDFVLLEHALGQVEHARFDLSRASSLAEAERALARASFDVVLLDLSLPDGSGLDSLRGVRAAAPDVAIAVLTGLDDQTMGVEAVKRGAQDYLVKGSLNGDAIWRALCYCIERRRATAEIRALNETLEQRVSDRTRALTLVTEELEGYLYSVTHDLRGAVRTIGGLSSMVLDDAAFALDPDTRDLLRRIDRSVRHIDEVLLALVDLSQIGRAPLRWQPLDLAVLASRHVRRLRAGEPDRLIEVEIPASLPAAGDAVLMELMLGKLLANAWRFTRREATPRVEVGRRDTPLGPVWYVRDNGVGFDMSHAHHLFRPFAHLHADRELIGVGLGLAAVRRVARLHEGAVWAEGEPNAGATFYFTLPIDPPARCSEARARSA